MPKTDSDKALPISERVARQLTKTRARFDRGEPTITLAEIIERRKHRMPATAEDLAGAPQDAEAAESWSLDDEADQTVPVTAWER